MLDPPIPHRCPLRPSPGIVRRQTREPIVGGDGVGKWAPKPPPPPPPQPNVLPRRAVNSSFGTQGLRPLMAAA